jgi:diaminopimelate decarboxylase
VPPAVVKQAPLAALREIVRRHGTPTYAYDLQRIRAQVDLLRTHLPQAVEVFYSLKANASLGLAGFLADCGLGADVASAGELLTALEAGFSPSRLLVTGPDCSPGFLAELRAVPEALVSIDSLSALQSIGRQGLGNRAILRLRPDFRCTAVCTTGPDSRFGLLLDELHRCRDFVGPGGVRVVGFHVFAGSQVLDASAIVQHLRDALDLSRRAADALAIVPEVIDLGGGFGVPYGAEGELDLATIGATLHTLVEQAAPARIIMELGRFLVAHSGWYLTSVLALQRTSDRRAVVVDGGTHQRGDMCGVGLRRKAFPPIPLEPRAGAIAPTDVLGCLSHPGDVLTEAGPLPPLAPGDVLAFAHAGAYGLAASPWMFHGHPAPAEAVFDGMHIKTIRVRQPARSVLDGQVRFR